MRVSAVALIKNSLNLLQVSKDSAYKNAMPLALKSKENDAYGQFEYVGKGILSPKEELKYRYQVSTNSFVPSSNDEIENRKQWIHEQRSWRFRLRGIRYENDNHKSLSSTSINELQNYNLVGIPIFLPNISFRLMRNNTQPGEPYNPYFATFRVPRSLTKQDIKSYLLAVYNVRTTWVNTDLYQPRLARSINMRWTRRSRGDGTTGRGYYKRALVGLEEPFYYPDEPTRDELENKYAYSERDWMTRRMLIGFQKGWRWRGVKETGQRGATKRLPSVLKAISMRREEREQAIENQAKIIKDQRSQQLN